MKNSEPNLETTFDIYKISRLTKDTIPELQKLLEECSEYFKLVFNKEVQPNEAEDLLQALPVGKTLNDKFNYGIYKDNKLIGIIDLIRNYPEEKTWFLGLLLIHPKERGNGLGAKVFNFLLEQLKSTDTKMIKLSVAEQNTQALSFWKSLDFIETHKKTEGNNTIIYFEYNLNEK